MNERTAVYLLAAVLGAAAAHTHAAELGYTRGARGLGGAVSGGLGRAASIVRGNVAKPKPRAQQSKPAKSKERGRANEPDTR